MEHYVAKRNKYPFFVCLCLLCLCLAFAGCTLGGGDVTTDPLTDPIPEITASVPDVTTEEITEELTADTTDEITTEPDTTGTAAVPEPIYAPVSIYGASGDVNSYDVEVGQTLPTAALEAAILPSDSDTVKAEFKGWEYSIEKNGEKKPYDVSDPPAVSGKGMHIYPIIEYSYLVSFSAGDGSFADGVETRFFVRSGNNVKLSELMRKMPSKAEDEEYSYPLLGFDLGGKIILTDAELTVDSPLELTAVYGKSEIEYTVIAHTEIGELPDGGKTFVFKGNYKKAQAYVDSYKNYSSEDVYFNHAVYSFREVRLTREGREWELELLWDSETLRYTVSFDHSDGNAPTLSYVAADGKVILPTDARREDEVRYYDFVGWRDSNGYLYNGGYEFTVTENVAFKAEYAPGARKIYTVVFDTEIGVFGNGSASVILTGYYGDPLLSPAPPEISELTFGEVVYRFAGWDSDVAAAFTENASYTAVYTTDQPVYFLNLYVDGELYLRVPHYAGVPLSAPERPEFTKGKIFLGWLDLPETMPAQDLDINADTRAAMVIYILDGEIVSQSPAEVGSLVTLAAPAQKYGHTVSGWSTSDIGSINEGSFVMPEGDVCFKAESAPKPHTVNYILDGVTVYTDSVLFGDIYTIRGIEVKKGYRFTGWRIQDTSLDAESGIVAIPDNDLIFIGGFEICSYNVNYYLDGILIYKDTYCYGDTVTLRPDEVQEGCSFEWNSAGANISSGSFRMPAGDIDIHGAFSDGDNKLILIIDGEEYGTLGIRAGKTVNVSFYPAKIGYSFTGWNCDDIDLSSGEFVMPEGDVILRGSFIPNAHSLIFFDMASDTVIGMSYLDFGSSFSLGDRVYCEAGKVSTGWVLLDGDAVFDGEVYTMPDSEVVFGIVWEDCLTLEIEEEHWIPYYDLLEYECEGCRYDGETKTLYISDPAIKVGGENEDITVVYEYEVQ